MNMRNILNGHALGVLCKKVEKPNKNLGVAGDEKHKSIPILIFTEQYLKQPVPEMQALNEVPYEKMQKAGTGNSLAMDDFETQAFYIGHPFGGDC